MATETETIQYQALTDTLSIKEYLSNCKKHWRWFLYTTITLVLLTVLYLLVKNPTYERSTSIMIKDSNPSSNITAGLSAIQSLGFIGGSSNVSNELVSMQTPYVMVEVVKRLKLDYNYYTWEFIREVPLYGKTLPIQAEIDGLTDEDKASFKMELKQGTVHIWNLKKNKEKFSEEVSGSLNKPIKSPIGNITIRPTSAYRNQDEITIKVERIQPYEQAQNQKKQLLAGLDDEMAQVITLTYEDPIPERAIDILNMLINVYNEDWMRDKNDLVVATTDFIDGRLNFIEQELKTVEENITDYKSQNLIPDIVEVSKLYMAKVDANKDQLVQLNSQMYMATYVRDFLKDNSNKNELLPANLIINDQNIEQQIVDYNNLQLQRNRLVLNSSDKNPLVLDMDKQLKSMRQAVLATIDNVVKQLKIQINSITKSERENLDWIGASPVKAKHLLSVERQQKVKETLYIFLLQKREENVLSQAFTAYNTRILTPPMGSVKPASPHKLRLLALALFLGILLPAIVIFMMMSFTTKPQRDDN